MFLEAKIKTGRGDMIRTCDPLIPNQMRYQAALRPEAGYCSVHRQVRSIWRTRHMVGREPSKGALPLLAGALWLDLGLRAAIIPHTALVRPA
ncbi:hypothetical protein CO2235_170187 [Cupriavidus oxalaticus]|uniref:Uncharacterized protein n=1 Tax=Cupriavidus oxalaticus TaxID=96344 RepID=A0A375G107_9BURK|nr:hypothetical protein CO2235_170187 [Cupriavidus oxalaticus]